MIRNLLKDPLLHFSLAGAALFGAYSFVGTPDESMNATTIVVDQDALLTFMQYRSKAFQPEETRQQLAAMGPEQKQELIRDYVREEALYREARALGMLENDYIIRRRSVQKLEFIAEGVAERSVSLDSKAVETYFEMHRQDYYEQPSYNFTHVFIKSGTENAQERAEALLNQLNTDQIAFSEATQFGDRFLYHRNYVERTPDFIASHFGEEFKTALESLEVDGQRWQGPIPSDHGQHLVMLSEHRSGRVPELAEVRDRVENDYMRWQHQQKQAVAIQQIVEQYNVENRL